MRKKLIKAMSLLLALTFFAVLLPPKAKAIDQQPPEEGELIQVLYDDAGLLSNEANVIEHTRNGYIWVGSYGGLARYDSHSFVTYGDDDESIMCGVSVRTLFEDSKGRLWIGSNEKGVFVHENGVFSYVDTSASGISGSIRAFAEAADGIYVASTAGIAKIADDEVIKVEVEGISNSTIADMCTDSEDRVWVIDNDSVAVIKNGEIQFNGNLKDITGNDCNCISEISDGRMLIGTSGSEIIEVTASEAGFKFRDVRIKDSQAVNCIMEDRYGRIWLSSDDGLGYLEGSELITTHGIKFTSIEHIEEDYEGNLWLASSRLGVMELVRGKFNNKSLTSSLEGVTVNATQMYEGKLFAGTDVGLTVVDPVTFKTEQHVLSKLLKDIRIRGLFVDNEGYLWISTYREYGVVRYKDGEYIIISPDKLASEKNRIITQRSNGDIVVTSGGGVCIIRGTKVIEKYTDEDGLKNPVILSVCEDNDGNLYFGSDGSGIYLLKKDGTVENYTTEHGLGSDIILNLKYDEKMDAVWISTGSNIAVWDENGIRNISEFSAGTGSIFDLIFTDEKIWILRNTSVVIATREQILNGASSSDYVVLGRKDGLTDITSNSRHYLGEDGTLYLATSNGIYTINTEEIYANNTPPQAIINSITVDGKTYDNPAVLSVDSSAKRITIEFSALNYSTGSCDVKYQLVGSDDKPIVVNGDKTITRDYTNLRGGNYIFRVSVTSPSGVTTENAIEMKIVKQHAFYENVFFIIGVIILGIALIAWIIYVAVKVRTATLLKRQERYRSLTESAMKVAARSIDAKDSYTNGHSFRVAEYSREIARRLGWSDDEIENVYYMALVHDIGKIGVPDSVLNKPSKLTKEENELIKEHARTGAKILEKFEGIPDVELGAKYHHERYDGKGYCEGLKGEEIPIVGRIIAVADAYDAMASTRVYRPRLELATIYKEIEEGKGTQFDPNIADIMLKMLDEGFESNE